MEGMSGLEKANRGGQSQNQIQMRLEPFTYYKNEKEGRAFLMVQCPTEQSPTEQVVLIEWGQTRDHPVRLAPENFEKLLNKGLMKQFTPTL